MGWSGTVGGSRRGGDFRRGRPARRSAGGLRLHRRTGTACPAGSRRNAASSWTSPRAAGSGDGTRCPPCPRPSACTPGANAVRGRRGSAVLPSRQRTRAGRRRDRFRDGGPPIARGRAGEPAHRVGVQAEAAYSPPGGADDRARVTRKRFAGKEGLVHFRESARVPSRVRADRQHRLQVRLAHSFGPFRPVCKAETAFGGLCDLGGLTRGRVRSPDGTRERSPAASGRGAGRSERPRPSLRGRRRTTGLRA